MKNFLLGLGILVFLMGCGNDSQDDTDSNTSTGKGQVAPVTPVDANTESRPVTPSSRADNNRSEIAQARVDARTAIRKFSKALQSELNKSIRSGGVVAAIEVCNTLAMAITEKLSAERGMQLKRVSLDYRNPANAPNKWQAFVLDNFESQMAAGKEVDQLSWSTINRVGRKREFRFMQAIPAKAVCLECHGTSLAPDVSDVLAELYPQDRATGFYEGDIRGAFVVTRNLP